MNINIPPFYAYIRREHMFAYESNFGEFEYCYVFGARSPSGRAIMFHCMTEGGAQRANVPISALVHDKNHEDLSLEELQLWDSFGNKMNVVVFNYLEFKRCQVVLRNKRAIWGTYLMTFDWEDNPYTDAPQDYKNAHLIKLDNGCFALQPNNRILWRDSNFITNPLDIDNLPKYKVDKKEFVCEVSDRWTAEDTDCFYYDILDHDKEEDGDSEIDS